MSITYKSLSHNERMHNPSLTTQCTFKPTERYEYFCTQELNEKTGRISIKTKKRLVEKNRLKALKVTDFSMENLQAIGADKNLKTLSVTPDVHSAISSIETSVKAISNSEENNKKPK